MKAVLLMIGDACWPLHQALMLVVGALTVHAARWPSPSRWALLGPAAGATVLLVAGGLGADVIAAAAIGAGWAVAGIGAFAVSHDEGPLSERRAQAATA
jgi:hypothetical protein